MTTKPKSCLGPGMPPCEQYLQNIHLHCYQCKHLQSLVQGLCLAPISANGLVGSALWVNPRTQPQFCTISKLEPLDWKFIILE